MDMVSLSRLEIPTPLSELNNDQVRELQHALSILGYPLGEVDGLVGPKTRSALAEFKADVIEGHPDLVGPKTVEALIRLTSGVHQSAIDDFSSRDGTVWAIRRQCEAQGIGLIPQIAYVLATVEWETAKTFKPVREAFWLTEDWRRSNLRYYPYYGRGYVQLTWENNYRKYSGLLETDLVGKPDRAMEPALAAFVLVHGFKTGTFTGRKLTDYVSGGSTDFVNARRCINGLDKAHEIAHLAAGYLRTLS